MNFFQFLLKLHVAIVLCRAASLAHIELRRVEDGQRTALEMINESTGATAAHDANVGTRPDWLRACVSPVAEEGSCLRLLRWLGCW